MVIRASAQKKSTRKDKKYMRVVKEYRDWKVVRKKTVHYGDPNMRIKKSNPERRSNFRSRHKCSSSKDKFSPRYRSCKNW